MSTYPVPAEGLAALRDGEVVSEVGGIVRSDRCRSKQEVFGGATADLSGMLVELRARCAWGQVRCPCHLAQTSMFGLYTL